MRYSLKEGVLFGVIIGAAALLIRTFVSGGLLYQLLVLMVVAIMLGIAQLLLGLRRAHPPNQQQPTTPVPPERPRRISMRRARSQDPFARETNQAWTGLSSTAIQEQEQREHTDTTSSENSFSASPQRTPESPQDGAPPANHRRS